jgi:hypothetical protein
LTKTKAIFLKQKETKFCVLNGSLYWKYPGGVLLKCILEDEYQQTMKDSIRVTVEVIITGKQQLIKF